MWLFGTETWALLAALFGLAYLYVRRRLGVLKQLGIPHDDPGFLGLNYVIRLARDANYMFLKDDIEMRKKHGKIYGRYNFLSPIITIWDEEILKQIYIKEFPVFPDRQKSLLKINGEMNYSLTSTTGHQWKRVRSTLTPAFSSSKLKEMFYIADNCVDTLTAKLHQYVREKEGLFKPKNDMGRFSMDTIASAAFSTSFNSQVGDKEPEVVTLLKKSFSADTMGHPVVIICMMFPWLEPLFELMDFSIFPQRLRDKVRKMTETVIQLKAGSDGKKLRTDLMVQMLDKKISESEAKTSTKGLTLKEIMGNSFLMILAGYETTAETLTFILYHLARCPEIQDRLREEIMEQMEAHDNKLNYECIHAVKYLPMVINEAMRITPIVPINMRFCERDIEIKGLRIPRGTEIQIPVRGLALSEEHWDDPLVFNPDRFEDMSKIDPMVFQPFGGGPRNCIGMRFALMEIKLALCKILTQFRIVTCAQTPPHPLEMVITITSTAKQEIVLKLEEL